jgi:thiamine kinase-like enzyme
MHLPELKMEGRSGCELIVEQVDGKTQIRKFSNSLGYNKRLIKQAEKQNDFFESNTLPMFNTAKVFDLHITSDELSWFTMPYLFAEKYSNYLDRIDFIQLKTFIGHLINYFDQNFNNAVYSNVNRDIFFDKIFDVRKNINNNQAVSAGAFDDVLAYLENSIPNEQLPMGTCHGDFTFSNILFGDHQVYLLDFLDSFVESPLIDIVKLRQDTCYKWSIMLENTMPLYKSNKLTQVFNYIDNSISQYCSKLGLNNWYTYLQAFNLIRIVPYLHKESEVHFIKESLNTLLK